MPSIASVVNISDFFSSASGSSPTDPSFLHWTFPIGAALVYVCGKFILHKICTKLETTGTSIPFQAFVVIHNSKLLFFSFDSVKNVLFFLRMGIIFNYLIYLL
jgi:hypothetical protein